VIVKVHVHAKFDQAKCSGDVTEKKQTKKQDYAENSTVHITKDSNNGLHDHQSGLIKAKTHYCDQTRLCRRPGSATKSGRVADLSGLVADFSGFFWVADLVGSISTCTDFFVGLQTSLVGSGRVAVVEFRNDPTKHE